jgi:hypothetical protein
MTNHLTSDQRVGDGVLIYAGRKWHPRCKTPMTGVYGEDAIWECDCGQRWIHQSAPHPFAGFVWSRHREERVDRG